MRAGKFVPRKQWIVAGSDDMQIRVYNYNTMEKVCRMPLEPPPRMHTAPVAWARHPQPLARSSRHVQVKVFEAHSDYIRCIAVHGSQPLLLSSSDDMTIRLWDWEKQVCPPPPTPYAS